MGSGKHYLRSSGGLCLLATLLWVLNCNMAAGLIWVRSYTADDCDDVCASLSASDALNTPMVAVNGGDASQALCATVGTKYAGTQFGHRAVGDTSSPPLSCTYYDGSAVVTKSYNDGYGCGCVLAPAAERYYWGAPSNCSANGFPFRYYICRSIAGSEYGFAMGWVQAPGMTLSAVGSSRGLLESIFIMEQTHMVHHAATNSRGRSVAPLASDSCMTAKGPLMLTSNFQYLCVKRLASCQGKPSNPPHPGEEMISWHDSCVGGEDASLCLATCSNNVTVYAVCNNGVWTSAANHCPTTVGASCNSLPQSPPDAFWPSSCNGAHDGDSCPGRCLDGKTITATCNKGSWSVSGSCVTSGNP
jgi:hypothetical protein